MGTVGCDSLSGQEHQSTGKTPYTAFSYFCNTTNSKYLWVRISAKYLNISAVINNHIKTRLHFLVLYAGFCFVFLSLKHVLIDLTQLFTFLFRPSQISASEMGKNVYLLALIA